MYFLIVVSVTQHVTTVPCLLILGLFWRDTSFRWHDEIIVKAYSFTIFATLRQSKEDRSWLVRIDDGRLHKLDSGNSGYTSRRCFAGEGQAVLRARFIS
jgi:hypothetical protein